ncbi:hypothetical protein HWV62_26520 [Athelia sp. TMB]|nr:hypothetical protein HWV62_26520 [Athelia sp. TMB]
MESVAHCWAPASTGTPIMAQPSLGPSLGATEIGVLLASVLYGVLNVQTYLYYQFLETLHMFITWAWLYDVTVTHYGDLTYFAEAHWTLSSSAVFDGVIGALVQGFFAHRIYVLSGKWPITIVSWIGSLCNVATNFAISVISQTVSVTAFAQDFAWITTTTLVLLLAVDTLNTTALCWYLRVEKTGVRTTDSMLNKLFQWTIHSVPLSCLSHLSYSLTQISGYQSRFSTPNSLTLHDHMSDAKPHDDETKTTLKDSVHSYPPSNGRVSGGSTTKQTLDA